MKTHHKLSDIGKQQPFRVPEGYFTDLPEKIMDQCEREEQKRSVLHIIKPALSLAAMFIGVALVAYFAISVIDRPVDQYQQEDIAEAEYFDQYFNQNELTGTFEDEETGKPEEDGEKTKEYIEYLLNEDIDYTTLINQLEEDEQGKGKKN